MASQQLDFVRLRTEKGELCKIKILEPVKSKGEKTKLSYHMTRMHFRWQYKVQNRNRWTAQSGIREAVERDAVEDLKLLGITEENLEVIANSGVVEVSIPYPEAESINKGDSDGWARHNALTIPWEYLLSAATKTQRGDAPLCVIRHLIVKKTGAEVDHRFSSPANFMVLESAPGKLREIKTFDAERDLIRGSLTPLTFVDAPVDPLKRTLLSILNKEQPDVIHVTAIDDHRAYEKAVRSGDADSSAAPRDGIFLSGTKSDREALTPKAVGELLNTSDSKPLLVGFNCWHSGSQLAPACIANGTAVALGFQNTFDDLVAEKFFSNFYRAWLEGNQDTLSAFLQGWEAIQPYKALLQGTGVVLWTATSLLKNRSGKQIKPNATGIASAKKTYEDRQKKLQSERRLADPERSHIRDLVGVKVKPVERINYSMLHNRRSILDEFLFWFKFSTAKDRTVVVQDIDVEVLLQVGEDSFPYRTRLTLSQTNPCINLADVEVKPSDGNPSGGVHVPLISELARSVDESMQTSLYVKVSWHGQVLYQHTHTVSLNPTDEWSLEEENIIWLPSFVQPRDPAVTQIVKMAQKYLRCLSDSPIKGFTGYLEDSETVDMQVQAIWSAIVMEHRLGYICPPPAYSPNAQRLRSPSQVIAQKHGTCLDLTLLFVSCLEWIELYPVILQTEVHAFAGYWTSEAARDQFLAVNSSQGNENKKKSSVRQATRPWISGKDNYLEVRNLVLEDQLIPLECTGLTDNSGFNTAWNYAKAYFFNTKEAKDGLKVAEKKLTEARKKLVDLDEYVTETVKDEILEAKTEINEAEEEKVRMRAVLARGEIDPKTPIHEEVDNYHSMIDICTARKFVTPLPVFTNKNGRS